MAKRRPLMERLTPRNSVLWCTFSIASVVWRVFLVDRESKKLRHEMRDHVGWTDVDAMIVLVGWDLPADFADQTAFHELLGHACVFGTGVALRPGKECSEKQEERVVNPLTAAQFDALRRNGWLAIPSRPLLPRVAR